MSTAQLILGGTITIAPPSVVGTTISASAVGTVPAGTTQVPLQLTPPTKQSGVQTHKKKTLSSPSSFQVMTGIGATDDVTTADTLYLKADGPIQVQLTMQNPAGGSPIVSVIPLYGSLLLEFPTPGLLTGISLMGSCNVEMLASGPQ